MLNSRQRAQLRGLANSLDTIFQIGKGGVTENTVKQVDDALEASPVSSREAADEIAEKTHSDVVQVIGTRFVLYRESRDNKQIRLVK